MKKLISLWLFLATLFLLLEAVEGQITFQKIFGPGTAYSIKQTSDNNLIVAGGPMFLLKMGQSGNVIWNKSYATTAGSADASSVAETADGGYIVCGTLNPGSPTSKVVLFKTDSDGNSQWANTYGGSKYEFGNGVIQTFDGGYIIIGSTKSFGTNFDDIYVIKTDSDGNLEWSKNIADTPVDDIDFGTSIVQAPDSGYVICGRIYNASNNSGDVGLIKLDASGNLLWSQSYGGTGDDRAYSIALTSDGGFALSGWTNSFGAGGWDNYVLKTDALGSINWSKAFGGAGNDFSYNISTTSSGGFVLTGTYDNLSAADVFLTEIDSMGDTLWTKNYGDNGSQGDVGFCSVKKGNSFFSVGQSNSFGGIYLIKTDSLGNSGCNQNNQSITVATPSTIVTTPSFTISPTATVVSAISFTVSNVNTVNTLCSLVSVNELFADPFVWDGAVLVIYDLSGRKVNQVFPDYFYIYRYVDKNKNEKSFVRRSN